MPIRVTSTKLLCKCEQRSFCPAYSSAGTQKQNSQAFYLSVRAYRMKMRPSNEAFADVA